MNKIFYNKEQINVFDLWKKIQIKLNLIHQKILAKKQKEAVVLLKKHELIFLKIHPLTQNHYEFDSNIFIALIRYLIDTNGFFDNRISETQIDELLLLAYVHEWICLNQPKDIMLLGSRIQVLAKLQKLAQKNNSVFQKIFEQLNYNELGNWNVLKTRINKAVELCYDQIIEFIYYDGSIYQKILNEKSPDYDYSNDTENQKLWDAQFSLYSKNIKYHYDIANSDANLIYIKIKNQHSNIGYVKFKLFYLYQWNQTTFKKNKILKELLRFELDERYQFIFVQILQNAYLLANRIIKRIFLIELQIQNDENALLEKNLISKKVVRINKKIDKKNHHQNG